MRCSEPSPARQLRPDQFRAGDLDFRNPGARLVGGLWAALWGRSLRDVAGTPPELELAVSAWAQRLLAPEGPYPAIRVGDQPYGLLPATSLDRWAAHDTDPDGETQFPAISRAQRRSGSTSTEIFRGLCAGSQPSAVVLIIGAMVQVEGSDAR